MGKNNMKKVLLLDTNVASFPMYEYLIKSGFDVYVIGSRPTDCLASYCESNYINADYSNIPLLEEIIDKHNFDYIVPGSNDASYLYASIINKNKKYFGIDDTEITETLNNKMKFRNFAISNGINVPMVFDKTTALVNKLPIIVKPTDAYSGRGVTVLDRLNDADLESAINAAVEYSKSKNYVIEEYVEGQLYSHSAFIVNKKIVIDFIVLENGTANKFTVDSSYVVHDDFPKNIMQSIQKDIEIISEKLNLVDGLIHTQFIKTKDSFRILEVTRRCPGDLYNLLIEKSTNFKYAENYVKPFINENIDYKNINFIKKFIYRHTISSDKDTFSIGTTFSKSLNIELFVPMTLTGHQLKKSPFSRFGLIFINCENYKDLQSLNETILNRKLYKL